MWVAASRPNFIFEGKILWGCHLIWRDTRWSFTPSANSFFGGGEINQLETSVNHGIGLPPLIKYFLYKDIYIYIKGGAREKRERTTDTAEFKSERANRFFGWRASVFFSFPSSSRFGVDKWFFSCALWGRSAARGRSYKCRRGGNSTPFSHPLDPNSLVAALKNVAAQLATR